MIRFFILFTGLFIANITFAQSNDLLVYPVRVDHKWGYAKFYGSFVDTLIPPRYDYIGDIYLPWNVAGNTTTLSTFRLFEIDKKVGLLNNFLQESLPNKYIRIRPISENYHAVEIDQGFQLINKKEEIGLDGMVYDDIKGELFDDRLQFFFVRKDRKWAVKNKTGTMILDHQFTAIQSAGISGFFNVKYSLNDAFWTLIDTTGTPILPDKYAAVKVIDQQVITVRKNLLSRWEYFLSKNSDNSFIKQSGEFTSIKKVTNGMLALVPYHSVGTKEVLLRSLEGDFEILKKLDAKVVGGSNSKQIIPDFYPLDEDYAMQSFLPKGEKSVKYKLIDAKGAIHSEFFDTIKISNKNQVYFGAADREFGSVTVRKWGVIQPVKNKVIAIETKYSDIFDFEDDIAITQLGDKYGAIAIVNQQKDELPCLFETVYKSGKKTLQIQTTSEKAVIYQLTEEGKFIEDLIVKNTIVFSESKQRNIKEAEDQPLRYTKKYEATRKRTWPYLNHTYEEGKLIIRNKEAVIQQTNITEEIISMEEISEDILVIHFKSNPIQNKATQIISEQPFARVVFFSLSKNKIVNEVPMVGFRQFHKSYPYTAFLDNAGKMGLIKRDGEQLKVNGKPLRFLYIGPFQAGRARVGIGDQLFVDKKDKVALPPRYAIGKVDEFMEEFNIKIAGKITFGKFNKAAVYALSKTEKSTWGFIDENGKLLFDTTYDYVEDFNEENERALVFQTLADKSGLKPKTSVELIDKKGKKLLDFEDDLLSIDFKNINKNKTFFQITVGKTPTFYFNQKGHQVFVNPTRMRPFAEGLALFRSKENKWGYVDSTGNIVIEPRFSYARPFSDGLAMVIDSSGFCSFINPKGTIVFKTRFSEKQQIGLGDFHEGRCWFKGKKGWFWGCLDKTGAEVMEPRFYYKITGASLPKAAEPYRLPMDFKNGIASIRILGQDKKPAYTIIDTTGNQKIKPGTFATIEPFDKNGLAVYSIAAKKEKGLLNSDGKKLCPPRYQTIQAFENGFAKVQSTEDQWGLINLAGEEVIKPGYQQIGLATEGLIPVKTKNRGWSFVDNTGKKQIPGPFKKVTSFQSGMSFVHRKEKDFLIDKSGNELTVSVGKPLFFSEGILGIIKNENASKKNKQYFYADESGNNILGRNFKEITPFQLGVAKVRILAEEVPGAKKKKQLLGAINKRGVMIVPPKFRNLHLQPDGNIVINPQRFYGLVTLSGKTLLEPIYDLITYYPSDKIFRAEQGEKVGYFELDKDVVEWIWEMRY